MVQSTIMASLLDEMGYLEDHELKLSSKNILKIRKKYGCSERWVWEAWRRYREMKEKTSEILIYLNEMRSGLQFLTSLMESKLKLKAGEKITLEEQRQLDYVDDLIASLTDDLFKSLVDGLE